MTGRLEIDFAILTEKLQQVCDQIEPYGRVADFLENEKVITKCKLRVTSYRVPKSVALRWPQSEASDY